MPEEVKRRRPKDGGRMIGKLNTIGLGHACLVSIMLLIAWTPTVTAASAQVANPLPLLADSYTTFGQADNPIPLLAYYYIWFDVSSWDRAKTDYPLLGRYSSD